MHRTYGIGWGAADGLVQETVVAGPVDTGCSVVAAASLTALAYWPGLMTWDAIRQYGQAVDGDFDDWHPPVMEWIWRQLIPIHTGECVLGLHFWVSSHHLR